MHELSLATELVKIIEGVAAENGAARVTVARLEVGALTCVEPAAMRFAFEVVTKGTVAEGCALQIEPVPLTARCARCEHQGEVSPEALCCPSCGGTPLEVLGGRELRLISIDAEEEDTCDA